jgi:predicted transcriptional regulator
LPKLFWSLAMTDTPALDLVTITADITSAYVGNNKVAAGEVAGLIVSIHQALEEAGQPAPAAAPAPEPAVPIRLAVKPDSIACLECGRRSTMLKRHLQTAHALTPGEYREKWSLPRDYPMAAATYAAKRSAHAKSVGLGRNKAEEATQAVASPGKPARRKLGIVVTTADAAHPGGEAAPAPAKRGRPRRTDKPADDVPAAEGTANAKDA